MDRNYTHYTEVSYSGRRLLEQHLLSEKGIWEVRGEDPNCDMGGPHHQPFLGIFEGTLEDIIHYAVQMDGFWQWGGGGSIKKMEIVPLKDVERLEQEKLKKSALSKLTKAEKTALGITE